ncbi:MAG: hypothetical protein HYS24_12040 [Ignavibacteriales bacterium]|nr:hypothetical protein [Ignavibacteriales bacterium]MBK7980705.1 hypothetical protein [Ignavibacteriota bacterium]
MNTGQMMITMAAMILLSTVILSVNKNALNTTTSMAENKYEILGISLGTALIEEAFSKSFDAYTSRDPLTGNTKQAGSLSDLTNYNNLGPNFSERNRRQFNDFDDYNGFVDSTSNASLDSTYSDTRDNEISAIFKVESKVYYIDPSIDNLLRKVNYRTWHKRIDVSITSKYLNDGLDTIKLSKIYSYYFY